MERTLVGEGISRRFGGLTPATDVLFEVVPGATIGPSRPGKATSSTSWPETTPPAPGRSRKVGEPSTRDNVTIGARHRHGADDSGGVVRV